MNNPNIANLIQYILDGRFVEKTKQYSSGDKIFLLKKALNFAENNSYSEEDKDKIKNQISSINENRIKRYFKKLIYEELESQKKLIDFNYTLNKFPSLKQVIINFLTSNYHNYIEDIHVVAPRPTTFRIILKNGQNFFLTYGKKGYTAKIEGKKYYLPNIGEEERASQALADLLSINMKFDEKEGPSKETDNTDKKSKNSPSLSSTEPNIDEPLPPDEPEEETEPLEKN